MSIFYLLNYSVRGIKSIDEWVELSFYKKTINRNFSFSDYNIKGIYGANGSGKSAIITSVRIIKKIIQDDSYLNNSLIQKKLDELVNKKLGKLEMSIEFLVNTNWEKMIYRYYVCLEKSNRGRFVLGKEMLSQKTAFSHTDKYNPIYEVGDGVITLLHEDSSFSKDLDEKTKNLLLTSSLPALYVSRNVFSEKNTQETNSRLGYDIMVVWLFANNVSTYLDSEDDHTDFVMNSMVEVLEIEKNDWNLLYGYLKNRKQIEEKKMFIISTDSTTISKDWYPKFEELVEQLTLFIKIFKKDLQNIIIERKENKDIYQCSLIMDYGDYSIHSEFESTGVKKLIRLFTFITKMAQGGIVFIDEFDSNLHDVYLCALLEYLREHGKGQLCFTTHNIGPMDVLKKGKKSIDFLSIDHTIYSWTTSGNYSPGNLYRNGMIEGSPFNVDSIDFIGVFDEDEDN